MEFFLGSTVTKQTHVSSLWRLTDIYCRQNETERGSRRVWSFIDKKENTENITCTEPALTLKSMKTNETGGGY